jgi:hypothetical protein
MKHTTTYPAPISTTQEQAGKAFTDERLRVPVAGALSRHPTQPKPTRQALYGELHVLELQIRTLLRDRRTLKRRMGLR